MKEKMERMSYDTNFPIYQCGFIDILGYRNHSASFFEGKFDLFECINNTLSATQAIWDMVDPFVNKSECTIKVISDSIIIYKPNEPNSIGAILYYINILSTALLYQDILLRGGIARGRHCSRKTDSGFDFVASEALQKAYLIESEQAIYPRILVEEGIVNDLNEHERSQIVSENGVYFLDIAKLFLNQNAFGSEKLLGLLGGWLEATKNANSERIREKYSWLLRYFCWSISQHSNWNRFDISGYISSPKFDFTHLSMDRGGVCS